MSLHPKEEPEELDESVFKDFYSDHNSPMNMCIADRQKDTAPPHTSEPSVSMFHTHTYRLSGSEDLCTSFTTAQCETFTCPNPVCPVLLSEGASDCRS
ncbi:hypothetical protein WMY93_033747 [Mugilogobius chulae]|uniref:Uncharacterized protein n=1 Tax=Mugilogobius chulae TaxID=88201 RepID=A0AAW0MSU6_9GOBI